jgi:hypothetical protein
MISIRMSSIVYKALAGGGGGISERFIKMGGGLGMQGRGYLKRLAHDDVIALYILFARKVLIPLRPVPPQNKISTFLTSFLLW